MWQNEHVGKVQYVIKVLGDNPLYIYTIRIGLIAKVEKVSGERRRKIASIRSTAPWPTSPVAHSKGTNIVEYAIVGGVQGRRICQGPESMGYLGCWAGPQGPIWPIRWPQGRSPTTHPLRPAHIKPCIYSILVVVILLIVFCQFQILYSFWYALRYALRRVAQLSQGTTIKAIPSSLTNFSYFSR
jgi:hypothetical protein